MFMFLVLKCERTALTSSIYYMNIKFLNFDNTYKKMLQHESFKNVNNVIKWQ